MENITRDDLTVFGSYSRYYDLLYRDKDYRAEAKFVDSIIKEYNPTTKTVIDLGCGTGQHDICLSGDYVVTGVDQSEQMLVYARNAATSAKSAKKQNPMEFHRGDIRTLSMGSKFDCAISLFHVMSYQTRNTDIQQVFVTVKNHLHPGGLFIFDFWYGPAVLTERPAVRVKRMEDNDFKVIRIAEPEMFPNDNIVHVNYTTVVINKQNNNSQELRETHRMRYYFIPEIRSLLLQNGFEVCEIAEWLSKDEPGFQSWNVYVAARI